MSGAIREDKERAYIEKSNELQRIWKNPPQPNYDQHRAVKELTDERLDQLIQDTISQIRFEKFLRTIKILCLGALGLFVALGVIGLLLFGIRHLIT